MTDSDAIGRLILSDEYRTLQKLTPEFNFFCILDDAHREPAWSRMFAGILDSTLPHALGTAGLREWMGLVAAEVRENNSVIPAFVSDFPEGFVVRVSVEYVTPKGRRIDILVRILDSQYRVVAVIGIENKLGSPEQPAQISDYQAALSEVFRKGIHRLIVYLTPDRREARTASAIAECPYLPASYKTMVGMCRQLATSAAPQVGVLLESLSREIETEVLGEDKMKTDAAALISRLWIDPDHRTALRLIAECVPTPRKQLEAGLRQRIEQGINAVGMQLDDDSVSYYPHRSANPHEIKVCCGGRLAELTGQFGFYLYYMLSIVAIGIPILGANSLCASWHGVNLHVVGSESSIWDSVGR